MKRKIEEDEAAGPPIEKEMPNFKVSGKLAQDTNQYNGIVLKYSEPAEARIPSTNYVLYVFKGDDMLETIPIYRQSAYLIGRERAVVDIPTDHTSCSKQHAVIQYRQLVETNEFRETSQIIKPYLIDLKSANSTRINGKKIPKSRFVELKIKDVINFGFSSRDYVFMSEELADKL